MTIYAGPGPWGPGKGSPLTKAEFDGNNNDFDTRLIEVETNPPQPNDIVGITLTGSYLSMTQRDGTIIGPVPFSPPMARWRNEWAVSTAYVAFDFVTVSEVGLFGVLQDHTSDDTAFNADATDVDGNLLYRKVIGFSGSTATIGDLLDVVITSAADKDMLVYDAGSTHWVNKTKTQVLANLLGSTSGVLKANGSGTVSAAVAGINYAAATSGSANTPLFNDGSGGFTNGTRAGDTTEVATVSGSLTSGHIAAFDASGNIVDGGAVGGGGGGAGDVSGPGSATDGDIVVFDGATGKQVKESSVPITAISQIRALTKTADYTVLTGDSGKRLNNIGAGADIVLSLPAAASGLIYGFAVFANHYIKLLADGTDVISWGGDSSAGGGYVRSTTQYSFLQLEAHGTGRWIVSASTGTWGIDV